MNQNEDFMNNWQHDFMDGFCKIFHNAVLIEADEDEITVNYSNRLACKIKKHAIQDLAVFHYDSNVSIAAEHMAETLKAMNNE